MKKLQEIDYQIVKHRAQNKTLPQIVKDLGKTLVAIQEHEAIIIAELLGKGRYTVRKAKKNIGKIKQEARETTFKRLREEHTGEILSQLREYGEITKEELEKFWESALYRIEYRLTEVDYVIFKKRAEEKTQEQTEKETGVDQGRVGDHETLVIAKLLGKNRYKLKTITGEVKKIKEEARELGFEGLDKKNVKRTLEELKKHGDAETGELETFWENVLYRTDFKLTKNDYRVFKQGAEGKTQEQIEKELEMDRKSVGLHEAIIITKLVGKNRYNTISISGKIKEVKQEAKEIAFNDLKEEDIEETLSQLREHGEITKGELRIFWLNVILKIRGRNAGIFCPLCKTLLTTIQDGQRKCNKCNLILKIKGKAKEVK